MSERKPKTKAEWAAWRCKSSCQIGRAALEGKTPIPEGSSQLEYAVYNLLHAISEIPEMLTQSETQCLKS